MDPDLETRRAIFRGLLVEYERAERLLDRCLRGRRHDLIARRSSVVFELANLVADASGYDLSENGVLQPVASRFKSLLFFSASDRWGNAPLSPEHRAYLNQILPQLRDSDVDSKLVPFCNSELSASAPRWKVVILTWVGACVTVGLLESLFGPWMTDLSWFTKLLIFNAAVVGLLTWVVMPAFTWLAQRWLRSS